MSDDVTSTIIAVVAIIGGAVMIYVFGVKAFENLVHAADIVEIFKNFVLFMLGGIGIGLGIRHFTKTQ
jgi:hypothetical protein